MCGDKEDVNRMRRGGGVRARGKRSSRSNTVAAASLGHYGQGVWRPHNGGEHTGGGRAALLGRRGQQERRPNNEGDRAVPLN